jgi:D-ribose pyranase
VKGVLPVKKIGTLNRDLSAIIASLGHGDMLVIADAGLPIPPETLRLDLALTVNIPGFMDTLKVVLSEMQVEEAIVATEMPLRSPDVYKSVRETLEGTPLNQMSHEDFKSLTHKAVAVVRTGECTPYANIILKSGVFF